MNNSIDNCFITDPEELKYISDVVNQVLDDKHNLTDVKDFQAALREASLELGREIQMNLVFDENQLSGFNFSFQDDPNKTTATIPFKQQQLNVESEKGSIISKEQTTTISTKESKSNLISLSSPGYITLTPELQVEDQHIINEEPPENHTILKSSFSVQGNINPGLINIANQLTNQQEVNGLLLTGLPLKSSISLRDTLKVEDKPDIQTAGLALIKRFEQVLPQEFINLKTGEFPKAFNWKDPESNKQYRFCFEAAKTDIEGNILIPEKLKGFDTKSGSNVQQVFEATLIDSKYNRWSIEQCDFNKNQIQSLNLATKSTLPNHSTVSIDAVGDFSYEM
ncbi:MAG: hypothetical protein HC917_25915 [Richelia sp. SM2_1_7]|nr:hypothetical protein [Richelia sp. SM2_1_7]